MTLRPGDRRIRAVVGQGPPAGDPWWVERSCARCGRRIDARSGAQVVYGAHTSTSPASAALCSTCAALLTPFRLAIDVDRLRALTTPDAWWQEVVDLVEGVLAKRAGPAGDVVWVRAQDVHALTRQLDTTRTDLAMRLRELGVLHALEVATTRESGPARRDRERSTANDNQMMTQGARR